ncbi:amidohydrolase family protein [Exilibacterium tricleocarpae]|uniref:Amidohydrolase family protein n=1 Tax=Exilibacterium tricleocarpae TaxID=2591008 RepID=A0A545U6S5_9GAMM|nr:amidohydrolase family protein [Exilibacterium tricleocarpae]TQV85144.1 amidohydrolase family protein [Exilibacterium tricleocarpae]
MSQRDPDGQLLPVRIDATSNGEYAPQALAPHSVAANELAQRWAGDNARRTGMSRRAFMMSLAGAASTLMAFNHMNAAAGKTGGRFELAGEAALDEAAAAETLSGKEFIFDIQGHYVNPEGEWVRKLPPGRQPFRLNNPCILDAPKEGLDYLKCLRADEFIKDIFLDSDTDMMVLSFVPSTRESEPLTIEEADQTRRIIDAMEGEHRLMLHGRVNPNQAGDLEDMERLAAEFPIAAWKTYTQWGPNGKGFFLTDDVGEAFIAKAKALGVRNIAIHKGLSFGPNSYEHSLCSDIGPIAKRHPDMNFIIYHSGYDVNVKEEAFVPGKGKAAGIDVLCQSLIDHKVPPNTNVYAELGSTWRFLMRDPEQAAHLLGKLIKYCGEHNVLWGTDSIWYGSPQDQIQALRAFQISSEFQERFGYPMLSRDLKARIFGLNATKPYGVSTEEVLRRSKADKVSTKKQVYLEQPDPSFTTYGPKTRAEFLRLRRQQGMGPG